MSKDPSVAVIGAGLGGLCAGIKLKQAGFDDFVILEKAARVGGTSRLTSTAISELTNPLSVSIRSVVIEIPPG